MRYVWPTSALAGIALSGAILQTVAQPRMDKLDGNAQKKLLLLLALFAISLTAWAHEETLAVISEAADVTSAGLAYESNIAYPEADGVYPAVALIHSFNGMQQGFRDRTDAFADVGIIVLAIGWHTFERSLSDAIVEQLLLDSIAFPGERDDVANDAFNELVSNFTRKPG